MTISAAWLGGLLLVGGLGYGVVQAIFWWRNRPKKEIEAAEEDCLLDLASAFQLLREHYAETSQDNRVATMDQVLAPGLFASEDYPTHDLELIVAAGVQDDTSN